MSKYLNMNQYDGSLGGQQPNPAGRHDVSSPGGLSSIQHHWTHGMFGTPEVSADVYGGTGNRYIAAEYGNLYQPASHGYVHSMYYGPDTQKTKYTTLEGEPYFWMNTSEYMKSTNPQDWSQKKTSIDSRATSSVYGAGATIREDWSTSQNNVLTNNSRSAYGITPFQPSNSYENFPSQESSLPHSLISNQTTPDSYRKPLDGGIEGFVHENSYEGSEDFDLIGGFSGSEIPQNFSSEESNLYPIALSQNPTQLQALPLGKAMQNISGNEAPLSLSTASRNVTPHLKKYLEQQGKRKRSTPIGSKPVLNTDKDKPVEVTELPEYSSSETRHGKFFYFVVILSIVVISAISIHLWTCSAMKCLHNIHGKEIALPRLVLYSVVVTSVLLLIMYIIGMDVKDVYCF